MTAIIVYRRHARSDSAAFFGAVVSLIFAALVLMFAGIMVKGLRVAGFVPALIGAVAIAVISADRWRGWITVLVKTPDVPIAI